MGHCFTYDPPMDGLPNFEGGIGLFLGRKDSNYDDLHNNKIFIHERGQFWPNQNVPGLLRHKQGLFLDTKLFFQAVKYQKVKHYFIIKKNQLLDLSYHTFFGTR